MSTDFFTNFNYYLSFLPVAMYMRNDLQNQMTILCQNSIILNHDPINYLRCLINPSDVEGLEKTNKNPVNQSVLKLTFKKNKVRLTPCGHHHELKFPRCCTDSISLSIAIYL